MKEPKMEAGDVLSDDIGPVPNFNAYKRALSQYEDPSITFHPSTLDQATFDRITSASTCKVIDGVMTSVAVTEAQELVDGARCLGLAREVNPGVEEADVSVGIMPAAYIISKLEDIRRISPATSQYIFVDYDVGAPGSELISEGEERGFVVHQLLHETANTQAGMNLYQAVTKSKTEHTMPILRLGDVVDLGVVNGHEVREDGSSLDVKRGGQFSDSELSELWHLFRQRFQDISNNMPIRIEESEESTLELFNDPNYIFSYNTEPDGSINCAAFATEERDSYPWISPVFLDKADEKIESATGRKPYSVFVPGVAAYKQQGIGVSRQVLQRLTDAIAATGNHDIIFRFECTDVSSLYVPRIVTGVLKHNPFIVFESAEQLGQKKYVLLEIPAV